MMSETEQEDEYCAGIDLGTTFSCISFVDLSGSPQLVASINSNVRIIPSHILFSDERDEPFVGIEVKSKLQSQISRSGLGTVNFVHDWKRLIGKRYDDIPVKDFHKFHFSIERSGNNGCDICIVKDGEEVAYSPSVFSAYMLKHLKDIYEFEQFPRKLKKVVISVPAFFGPVERRATINAAKMAGLTVLQLVNEPTAAAFAHGYLSGTSDYEKKALVFDMGGGTTDITILTHKNNEYFIQASCGDLNLGGRDFDHKLTKFLLKKLDEVEKYHSNSRYQIRIDKVVLDIKHALSVNVVDSLDNYMMFEDLEDEIEISREDFEHANQKLIQQAEVLLDSVLEAVDMDGSEIDEIILAGGSTRMPWVRDMLKRKINKDAIISSSVSVDEIVAKGAALLAHTLLHDEIIKTHDVLAHTISVKIRKASDPSKYYAQPLISAKSPLPCVGSKILSGRVGANQVTAIFCQGESEIFDENQMLGSLVLSGWEISSSQQSFEIFASVDTNGMISLTVKNLNSDDENSTKTIDIDYTESIALNEDSIQYYCNLVNPNAVEEDLAQ